jgi:L-alanine-DL-glutamate epimerase-like enolase superfamily enzyme
MIERVVVTALRAPLHTPFVTALRTTSHVESAVVRVTTSDGIVGYGEAPQVWRVTGESVAGARACLEGPLAEIVLGRDEADLTDLAASIAGAVVGNHGAKAALEVALHDIVARRQGISLARLLGGPTAEHRVRTDVTVSAGDPEEVADSARARIAEGFGTLKLKVGTDARTDVARLRAVREAVGPDVVLRADANQGWTADQAIEVIGSLEDAGVRLEFVEQPVPAADLDGLARVTASVNTPVMADESVFGMRDLAELVRRHAADLVNIKLAKCGGLVAAAALHRFATEHGVSTSVGSMMEGPIGVGAAASFAAAYGTTCVADLDAAWWLAESPVSGGPTYDGETVVLPAGDGLGIDGLRADVG